MVALVGSYDACRTKRIMQQYIDTEMGFEAAMDECVVAILFMYLYYILTLLRRDQSGSLR